MGQVRDTHHRLAALVAAAVMLVLSGCGEAATSPAASDSPSAAGPEEHVTDKSKPNGPGGAGPGSGPRSGHGGDVAADAVRDLAGRLGVDPSEISVVSVEEVTWRDGSLGCPRAGMLYTQALTDGSRVVLEAQGRRYEYHAGGRRSAFLCENPEPPAGR